MWYALLKWVHILAAIIAVGANLTYSIWIARAAREPGVLPFVLRSIALIDRRVANPCYVVLLLTGLTLAHTISIPLTTPWLLTALVLYAFAALMGVFAYAPLARKQRQILETKGFESPAYEEIARKSTGLGLIVTIDVLIIVFLMVVKPAFWG
jgi:uncharacterized membrane protein